MGVEWVDSLPNSIRVGTHDCLIKKMDKPWGTNHRLVERKGGPKKIGWCYGDYDPLSHTIRIRRHIRSRSLVIDTIMHELTHAIWSVFLMKPSDKEERLVHMFASGLTQLLLDNPDFLRWLNDMRKNIRRRKGLR